MVTETDLVDALAFLDQLDDFIAEAEVYKLAAKLTDAIVGKEIIGDKSLRQLYQENAVAGQPVVRKIDATSQSAEAKEVSLLLERALKARSENGIVISSETSVGTSKQDETLKALAKRYGVEYTDNKRYRLLEKYFGSIEEGKLSVLVDFPLYEDYYRQIEERVIGQVVGDVEIKGQAKHFLERVFGCVRDPETGRPRTGVALEDVFDCIENPVEIGPIKIDKDGKPSFCVVGRGAKISINPDTGNLIQISPRRWKND